MHALIGDVEEMACSETGWFVWRVAPVSGGFFWYVDKGNDSIAMAPCFVGEFFVFRLFLCEGESWTGFERIKIPAMGGNFEEQTD